MVSGLPSILLLARNRRLNLFAFVNELINDPDALVTSCRIHLDCYVFFKKWQQTCFSREGHKNERYKGSRFTERNRIRMSQRELTHGKRYCSMQLYVFLIEPTWTCFRTTPLPVKGRLIGRISYHLYDR